MFSNRGSYSRKYGNCYDVSFKLRAVAIAEGKSTEDAAREFKLDLRRIREWCSPKKKMTVLKKSRKTCSPSLSRDTKVSL